MLDLVGNSTDRFSHDVTHLHSQRPVVAMDMDQEHHIQRLLHNIRTSDADPGETDRRVPGKTDNTGLVAQHHYFLHT